MCPWVGPHAPSFGRQLWGLPSRVEYLSPQGVLLPLVYGTTASALWLELRGLSAWQATPSWTVYRLACQRLLPWLRVTFAVSPMQPGRDRTTGLGVPPLLLARWVGWVAPVRPTHGVLVLFCPSAALRVHVCAVSWATWLLFTGVPARCVVLLVQCPGPLDSCSPVCRLSALLCVCGVLGQLAPFHRCARVVCCVACAVFGATWLLLTGVPAPCVVLRLRCPGPLGSCSPVCPLGALLCVCGVLGHLAPVHRCARSVCCFACAVSPATWLLFTGVPSRCVVLRVPFPGPLGSCSPVCPLGVLFCLCGVPGHSAPVHRSARLVRCFVCAVSWATWVLFTGVPARCVVLLVWCPGPLGSCSPVCLLGSLLCVCGFLGHLAPVHRCACSVCCVACAVSWATWLLFTGVPARCVVLRMRCPGPLGSCSPVCPLGALLCVCGVLGLLAPVHRCARSVRCFACAVSWATRLLFTVVPALCVVLLVRCPRPLGSCSPVCPLVALPVYAVSWATWLLFTGVPAWCVVLRVRCPGPLGSCSPVCPLGVLFCVCGVLGHSAPVHPCARSVRCLACAVSWAICLLFTGVPARCVVLLVRCPGPLGSCSPVCPLVALPVCAVSLATWLLFTGVPVGCVVLRVRCPGLLGSCSPVCPLGALFCLRVRCPGLLGSCSPVCSLGELCCGFLVRGVAAGRSLVHPDGAFS